MKRFEILFGLLKVPTDLVMTILAFLLSYKLRLITTPSEGFIKPIDYTALPTLPDYLQFGTKAAILLLIIFAVGKLYTLKTTVKFSREITKVFVLCGVWAMTIITYFFFTRTLPFSRLAILYSWILALILILFGRTIIHLVQLIFLKLGIGKRNLLFIGNNSITQELREKLSRDNSYKIMGTVDHIGQLEYIIKKNKIDEIIQTEASISKSENEDILELCDLNHINYRFAPDMIDVRRTNIEIGEIGSIPIISLKPTPLDGWGKVTKRTMDIFGSLIGLIVLSPVFLIATIAIKLDSKGPVFFARLDDGSPVKRIGQFGKPFKFYKFRTMHPNTDRLRYTELACNNIRTDGPLVKIANDPRVTRVGKFLRKTSIDELPQLWNVFIGNMSLVGPRPHLPEEVAKYEKHHRFVLTIKPGLSGLAQISGRSDLTFEEEVKLDHYYIENWSLLTDLKIILKSPGAMFKGYKE